MEIRAKQARVSLVEDSESDSEVDPTQFESTLGDDVTQNSASLHDSDTTECSSQQCVAHCCTTYEEAVDKPTLSVLYINQAEKVSIKMV